MIIKFYLKNRIIKWVCVNHVKKLKMDNLVDLQFNLKCQKILMLIFIKGVIHFNYIIRFFFT